MFSVEKRLNVTWQQALNGHYKKKVSLSVLWMEQAAKVLNYIKACSD